MRHAYVRFILNSTTRAEPLCSLDEAEELINYFDKRWHFPRRIREACIDEKFIFLKQIKGEPGIPSTGSCEGFHKRWDQFIMLGKMNHDITTVIQKVTGVCSSGASTTGLFAESEKRERDPSRLQEDISSKVSQARASLVFLIYKDSKQAVSLLSCSSATVRSFGQEDRCITRHAQPSSSIFASPFLPHLQLMADELQHGGGMKVTDDKGVVWYPLMRISGRCGCNSSLYHGVCSARGTCKHKRLEEYVSRYSSAVDEAGKKDVVDDATNFLVKFVNARERSKPKEIRVKALYECRTTVEVVEALKKNVSIPPTGKSTGLPDGFTSVTADDLDAFDNLQQSSDHEEDARLRPHKFTCTFARQDDLGLKMCLNTNTEHITVCAYSKLADESFGPAAHTGDAIRPGDVIESCSCNLLPLSKRVGEYGTWICEKSSETSPVILTFVRPSVHGQQSGTNEGGRPKKRTSKTDWSSTTAKAGRGGANRIKNTKSEKTRASMMKSNTVRSAGDRISELVAASYLVEATKEATEALDTMVYVP